MVSGAWAQDPYEISDAQDLIDFADAVNGGETTANAVLTKDIDLAGVDWTPIGNASVAYEGTFDGKGYKISGFNATSNGNNGGFFGKISSATVKNFSIDGSFTIADGKYEGVIAQCVNSTVSNVYSSLEISVTGTSASHMGGVVGSTESGTKSTISNCVFSGSITLAEGCSGSVAGVVGYMAADEIINCSNFGDITFEAVKCNAGGIVAYINNKNSSVKNCLNTGVIKCNGGTPTYGGAIVGRIKSNYTASKITNNYWLEGSASGAAKKDSDPSFSLPSTSVESVTSDQLASGEIAYALNGSQSENVNWFQKLGTDNYPTPYGSDVVYLTGHMHCDGTPYEGETKLSNTNVNTVDEHVFVNGFCSYCDFYDMDYMTPNTDGIYEIGTPIQLRWFAAFVNAGGDHMSADAVLTNDIDMEGVTWPNPIGNWVNSACYKGHFDGQGHAITGLEYTTAMNYHGFFGVISTGALIENFSIQGKITNTSWRTAGVVGYARDATPTIRNVHSFMDIDNSLLGGRYGGILGSSVNGTIVIEGCTYSGTLDGCDSGNDGNYGGIVGYINNNVNAHLKVTNCLFDGILKNTAETQGNCTLGGILGYVGANPDVTVQNCLSIGSVSSKICGQICGAIKAETSTTENTYYMGTYDNGSASTVDRPAIEVTTEQLASGEVAAKLAPAFRQKLGTDAYPTLDATKPVVAEITSAGYATLFVPETSLEIPEGVTAYTGTIDGEWLKLNPLENVITNGQAVVLKGNAGFYGFAPTDAGFGLVKSDLVAEEEDITADGTQYVLAKVDDKVGFYQAKADTKIAARKAYLKVPANTEVKGFTFAEESETAIANVNVNDNQAVIYNLAGQRISKMQKGINIVNGKKVLK
jgi:hypothetical protein